MRRSVYSANLARVALPVAARTATTAGTTVDRHVFNNAFRSVMFVIHTGTITDGTHTVAVEDSADGTTWAAADASNLHGSAPAITSSNDDTVFEVGYNGPKRYVRLNVTVASATTGGIYGAVAVMSGGRSTPVARS